MLLNCIAVGAGGCVGAILRYLISLIPVRESTLFPIKTFVINMVGCILIGAIVVLSARNIQMSPKLILFLKVGICGGFTTFSTFALETTDLFKSGHAVVGILYALLSVLVGVGVILGIEAILERA